MLYKDMLEYRLELTCQIFARLITIAGQAGSVDCMESYLKAFVAYFKEEPRPPFHEFMSVLYAYGEVFPLHDENITRLIAMALQFGMGPANCVRKLIIERLVSHDAPPATVWALLSDIENSNLAQESGAGCSPSTDVRFSFPTIGLIASYFLNVEGPQSMVKAVDAFDRLGIIRGMPRHCASQLYTLLIKGALDPPTFIPGDPIPLVAEFLSRLVALPTGPVMRKEFFSTLWKLSDQVTPRAKPWLTWLRLRKMLARAEDATLPPPTTQDLLALF